MENNNIGEINIHDLGNNLSIILWAFAKLTEKDKKDRFGQTEIADFLVNKNISISKQIVSYHLTNRKAKNFFNKNKKGFKIMQKGYDYLLNQKNNSVWYFESGEEYKTKRKDLKEIFKETIGDISICDPYIDSNTLDVISNIFSKKNKIRILTKNIIKEEKLEREIIILKNDGWDIKFKKYSNSELHDRYIITKKNMFLSGNSLNFIGRKESFFVKLDKDIKESMLGVFNRRWKDTKYE